MRDFIYEIPVKVYFGREQFGHLGQELSRHGKKVLLIYGGGSIKRTGLYDKVVSESPSVYRRLPEDFEREDG